MEFVTDLILYQVATDMNYKVGDVFTFDSTTTNGQYNRVFNSTYLHGEDRLSDYVSLVGTKKFKKFKSKQEVLDIGSALEAYDVITKELAIEEVRKELYPEYPSRFHCMYLSENKELAINNVDNFFKQNPKGKIYQAVAVKLNGKIFKAGDVYMSREGQSYNYYKQKAYKYWAQQNPSFVKEILFEGKAEIVEILKTKERVW